MINNPMIYIERSVNKKEVQKYLNRVKIFYQLLKNFTLRLKIHYKKTMCISLSNISKKRKKMKILYVKVKQTKETIKNSCV